MDSNDIKAFLFHYFFLLFFVETLVVFYNETKPVIMLSRPPQEMFSFYRYCGWVKLGFHAGVVRKTLREVIYMCWVISVSMYAYIHIISFVFLFKPTQVCPCVST